MHRARAETISQRVSTIDPLRLRRPTPESKASDAWLCREMKDTMPTRLGMDTAQSKNRLLLVDGDPKSLRVLDVSLKKAGFDVTTATSAREALAVLEAGQPDLIISDTDLDEMDGFELCSQIKARSQWAKIPFLFVSGRKSIEDKIRGLELGVDDYLTKPIYIKEIGIRVRTALQRAERERMESRREGRTRFAGDLSDVGVVDLVQTIELNRKSGIIHIVNRDTRRGSIFFRDGKVIDAEVGRLSGANAIYRLFSWSEGQFAVEFKQIRRHDVIDTPMAPLLMEGMRRLDESTRLLDKLPATSSVLEVDCRALAEELAELPDEVNSVLRLCDGTRTLQEVVEDSDHPDLEALTFINKLSTSQIIFAREAPDRGGESEPGDRLAHWLSEGGAEDGAAAEDASASSEFAAAEIPTPDGEAIPERTPVPAGAAVRTTREFAATPPAIEPSSLEREAPSRPEGPATISNESLLAPSPVPSNVSPTVPSPILSAEESLEAVLPPQADPASVGSNEFSPPSDTLKGLPVDTLFGDPEARKDVPSLVVPSPPKPDSNVVRNPMETRSTKPLGLAERLLSEDSAVRASAMHEAIGGGGGKVESSQSTDRNTREYGNPAAEAAAALVQEVISSAHEAKRDSPAPAEPGRPTKEVDWGAWPTGLPAGPNRKEEAIDNLRQSAGAPGPAEAPNAGVPSSGTEAVHAPSLEQAVPEEARAPEVEVPPSLPAPDPSISLIEDSAGRKEPPPASSAGDGRGSTADHPAAPPSPTAQSVPVPPRPTPRPKTEAGGRTARKTVPSRQIWLMAGGAFALGVIGYLALGRRASSPPEVPSAVVSSPSEQARVPQTAPAPEEPPKVANERKSPAAPKVADAHKAPAAAKPDVPPARLGVGTPSSAAADLRRKCLEVDAEGKGKARAVSIACRPALDADPKNVEVMVILARAEIDRGRLGEARSLAKKVLATDPQRLDAYVYLGTAEQEAGRLDEARAAYQKYLDLAPEGPFARELRAILSNL